MTIKINDLDTAKYENSLISEKISELIYAVNSLIEENEKLEKELIEIKDTATSAYIMANRSVGNY